jgi:uncharacterized membrane protein YgcG
MKRSILRWAILPYLLFLLAHGAWAAEDFPKPIGLVNDFAGLIPNSDKRKMEILTREILQKTGTSVVVVTIPTIGEADAGRSAGCVSKPVMVWKGSSQTVWWERFWTSMPFPFSKKGNMERGFLTHLPR